MVEENKSDDTDRKKFEHEARIFCVESVKRNEIGKIIMNSLSSWEIEQVIR